MSNQTIENETYERIQNPYPFYEEIRSIHPVYKGNLFKHPGWFVTGYQEAVAILKDHRFQTRVTLPENKKRYETLQTIQNNMMLFKNPPEHARLRMLVHQYFTPARIESYRPFIEEVALTLVKEVKNKQKIEVISDFAFPFASQVIAKLIGIPSVDNELFRKWAIDLIDSIDLTRTRRSLIEANVTTLDMLAYFKTLIEKKRQSPEDDLLSGLLAVEKENKLTEQELLATASLLVIAGHETTVNLISNSLYCFLTHPKQYEMLRANPSLIESAIEECLRYESPTQMIARVASEDVELSGVQIHKGEQVYVLIGAANRDPNQFTNPAQFDITRDPNHHLAFGSGIHFCLGSTLARLEGQVALQALIQNTKQIKLNTTNIEWRHLVGFRAMREMWVELL
ncbi:cytochrome P450 [Bacillus alkalicellulosilyticus]|uniref:cytochrome P450 n=1 Tax=Alkalihalobacterium alkalicellulosilyticum TaxID=1912214 RepID=UPI000997F42D|nr:cytochrome P450 [Bacillus alkalicellulosilyticus]